MAAFDYLALDNNGRKSRGIVEADSPRSARTLLRERKLTPLDVQAAKQGSTNTSSGLFQRNLSIGDTALVTRQIATLLKAGITLENCLDAVAKQAEKSAVKRLVLDLRAQIREGHGFSDSLKRHPRTFPPLYYSTVDAGERTGHLDLVLEKLADHMEAQRQFRQQIQLAMIYPVILVLLSLAIVTGLMIFVVPEILSVIIDSGQPLPLPTQVLVSISAVIADYGLWLGLCVVLAVVAAQWSLRQPAMKVKWHHTQLSLWGLKRFTRGTNAARYTSTLAILIQSGIPLNEAMPIASAVCGNLVFKQATQSAQLKVQEGNSLNKSLDDTKFFPPMIVQLIASGEQSGNLGDMLGRAATAQESDLQQRVSTLVGLFEPLTLLFMGAMVLGIVLAVLLPILNLNQLVH